jgi:hypothetical protein
MAYSSEFSSEFYKPSDVTDMTRFPGEVVDPHPGGLPTLGTELWHDNRQAVVDSALSAYPVDSDLWHTNRQGIVNPTPATTPTLGADLWHTNRQGVANVTPGGIPTLGAERWHSNFNGIAQPAAIPTDAVVDLMNGGTVLISAILLEEKNAPYKLNRKTFTTHGVAGQGVEGDGRVIPGEHTYNLFFPNGITHSEKLTLLNALVNMDGFRVNGRTLPARGLSIIGNPRIGEEAVTVPIMIAPTTHLNSGGGLGI